MGQIKSRASCLIKTREYYIGFPDKFSHYPGNMNPENLDNIHRLALEAMQEPGSIPKTSGGVRRIVIGDGKYLVLGICGYLCTVLEDLALEYNWFCDLSETRRSYGFMGFVWDLASADELPLTFPAIHSFAELLKTEIVPHWRDSKNSFWAENAQRGFAMDYQYMVDCEEKNETKQGINRSLNMQENKVAVFSQEKENLTEEAICLAIQKKQISFSTDLDFDEGTGTGFMNLFFYGRENGKLYDKVSKEERSKDETGWETKEFRRTEESEKKREEKGRKKVEGRNSGEYIEFEICFRFDCRDRKWANNDLRYLCNLMQNYVRAIDGKIIKSFQERVNIITKKVDYFYQIRCPLVGNEGDIDELGHMLQNAKDKGYLETVVGVDFYTIKSAEDESYESKPPVMGRLINSLKRSTKEETDDACNNGNKGTEFLRQLQDLYGTEDRKTTSEKKESGNPFEL